MAEQATYEELKHKISQLEKKIEKYALQGNVDKYHILFEKSKDANLIIKNGKFVDCNQATIDMLGYKNKTELIQTHPSELSPDRQTDGQDSLTEAKKMMALALQNGNHRFEWDHMRANGEIFPVEVFLTTISHYGNNWTIHTVWRDITNRKQIEKARQEEKETLSTILESTPHGITLLDKQGKYLYMNPYFTKITGYTLNDIVTKEKWFEKAYPDKNYREKASEAWSNDSNHKDQSGNRTFKVKCKDGRSKHIEFRSTFLHDRKISVLTDVTQRIKAQELLVVFGVCEWSEPEGPPKAKHVNCCSCCFMVIVVVVVVVLLLLLLFVMALTLFFLLEVVEVVVAVVVVVVVVVLW